MGINLVIMLASMVISYLLTPKPKPPPKATLEDFDMPTPDEGTPQYVVFGDVWISDWIVLSYGNLRTNPIKADGGK